MGQACLQGKLESVHGHRAWEVLQADGVAAVVGYHGVNYLVGVQFQFRLKHILVNFADL